MREKILDTTGKMFLNYGFKSVTMDDIANEMGISKKTIYKYFQNKVDLVDASTDFVQKTIDSTIKEITALKLNAIEENFAIKKVFQNMFKKAKTSPMFQLKKYYPETFSKLMNHKICSFNDCVMDNLERGINEKLYRDNIDKETIMKFYFLLIFGFHESETFSKKTNDIIKTEMQILEYHTRAIATMYGISVLEQELINYKNKAS
ncbi:MAG: TetR/AcrR family transcriptional regulator [Flavobacteriaceae bacterium]